MLPGSAAGGDAGVVAETTTDTAGGFQNIGFTDDGDYVTYEPVNLTGIDAVSVRAASATTGGLVELRWNAVDGPVLGTVDVTGTGGWQSYQDFRVELGDNLPTESGTLFVVFQSRTGVAGSLMNVNWFQFIGTGVSANSAPTLDVRHRHARRGRGAAAGDARRHGLRPRRRHRHRGVDDRHRR